MSKPATELSFGESVRVVLVATGRSKDPDENLPPLPQVEENVRQLRRVLQDPDVVGLESDSVVPIVNEPEASAIASKIAQAAHEARDTLIVYYAGHGLRGNQEEPLYLCSANTKYENRKFSGVPVSSVRKAIADSPAPKRILILDCCFAGAGLPGLMSDDDVVSAVKDDIDLEGTFAIAAVPKNRKALAPPEEDLTKFTGELIDVLEQGVKDAGEVLSIENIFEAVKGNLNREAMPVPQQSNWEDSNQFLFARNRFFEIDDLAQLKKSVEGLRSTLADYGRLC